MATIIAKNVTASGIKIPDLSGLFIGPYSQTELTEYFPLSRIENSIDLDDLIMGDKVIINDGTHDLTKDESVEHTYIDTEYEIPKTFLDLLDTPNTYSGIEYIFLKVKDSRDGVEFTPINFTDLSDIPTLSGYIGKIAAVKDDGSGLEFISPYDAIGGFGRHAAQAEDELESSTTSTSFIQKLRLSLIDTTAGYYRIGWFYEWSISNSSFQFYGRVDIDDSYACMDHIARPTSSYTWHTAAGFKYSTLTSGSHTIDLDYATAEASKTASIRRARLEIWRVL